MDANPPSSLLAAPALPVQSPPSPTASSPEKALLSAARTGDVESIKRLLGIANLHTTDRWGATPLHVATQRDHASIIGLLLDAGADPTIPDSRGNTPVHIAALHRHAESLPLLCRNLTADALNRKNERGHTPMSLAAYEGGDDLIRTLAQLGANVNGFPGCQIPLHCAAMTGRTATVQLLVSLGADAKQLEESTGNTVLHVAHMDHLPLLSYIKSCGLDVNVTNMKGETPLHLAIRRQSSYGREWLVKNGAFVDGNSFADSPLIEAIRMRCPGAVEYLIHHGANPNLPSLDGKSPLYIALEMSEGDNDNMSRLIKTLRGKDAKAFTEPRNRLSIV